MGFAPFSRLLFRSLKTPHTSTSIHSFHFIPKYISSNSLVGARKPPLSITSNSSARFIMSVSATATNTNTVTTSNNAAQIPAIRPASRVAHSRKDVWSTVNEAAASCEKFPSVINLGQGFFGYNPPPFVTSAAKEALDRVDCNQYSPTQGRLRLRQALAKSYSPFFGRELDPNTEIVITSGANEGCLSAFMGFVEQGDEVIVMEPFFDQYISNIEMAGGKVVYVPLHAPEKGDREVCGAGEWRLDIEELKAKITPRTRMIVINSPHNPIGKVFTREELLAIGELCLKHNIIILSDEVYDRLYYTPFTRISSLSPSLYNLTITVGSAGKAFYATGWRVGWLIGPKHLIKPCGSAHTRICFSSVSPLQEAAAVGLEQADALDFWTQSKSEMLRKMKLFNEIWDELGIPYTRPDGGYFVLVNLNRLGLPEDYPFPEHVLERARDFRLCWWLIMEIGVAAIPPTEFYTKETEGEAEDYLRFAVCKEDDVLEAAKERLRALKKYLRPIGGD